MFKRGFVSLPFLVLFSLSMSLCAYLCHKTMSEIHILESMKIVNAQIQKEQVILKRISCLIQCDHPHSESLMIDDEEVWIECAEGMCQIYASFGLMEVQYDQNEKRILHVSFE